MDVRKTCENLFDMNKNDVQSYLRDTGLKVSGNKRELAQWDDNAGLRYGSLLHLEVNSPISGIS
jgi:hypothetical protein